MTSGRRLAIAGAVAAVIFAAGLAYELLRPAIYASSGSLVLSPLTEEESNLTNLLQGFERSGTMGTFVELIASDDTLQEAGDPPVTMTVRAVPDTRVIRVDVTGDREVVNPALSAVLVAARDRRAEVNDLWDLQTLEEASAPVAAPPSTMLVMLATIVLSVLGAAVVFILFARLFPRARVPEIDSPYRAHPDDEMGAPPMVGAASRPRRVAR